MTNREYVDAVNKIFEEAKAKTTLDIGRAIDYLEGKGLRYTATCEVLRASKYGEYALRHGWPLSALPPEQLHCERSYVARLENVVGEQGKPVQLVALENSNIEAMAEQLAAESGSKLLSLTPGTVAFDPESYQAEQDELFGEIGTRWKCEVVRMQHDRRLEVINLKLITSEDIVSCGGDMWPGLVIEKDEESEKLTDWEHETIFISINEGNEFKRDLREHCDDDGFYFTFSVQREEV